MDNLSLRNTNITNNDRFSDIDPISRNKSMSYTSTQPNNLRRKRSHFRKISFDDIAELEKQSHFMRYRVKRSSTQPLNSSTSEKPTTVMVSCHVGIFLILTFIPVFHLYTFDCRSYYCRIKQCVEIVESGRRRCVLGMDGIAEKLRTRLSLTYWLKQYSYVVSILKYQFKCK